MRVHYISGSQMGVRGPQGVREPNSGGPRSSHGVSGVCELLPLKSKPLDTIKFVNYYRYTSRTTARSSPRQSSAHPCSCDAIVIKANENGILRRLRNQSESSSCFCWQFDCLLYEVKFETFSRATHQYFRSKYRTFLYDYIFYLF